MNFDDLKSALDDARRLQYAADRNADTLAEMLDGRLRKVGVCQLRRLKRELADFDAIRGTWNNGPRRKNK